MRGLCGAECPNPLTPNRKRNTDLAPLELTPAAGGADCEGASRLRAFFARAGDNPRALMERGWPLEMDGCAELDVTVTQIGAAGSSEYLLAPRAC